MLKFIELTRVLPAFLYMKRDRGRCVDIATLRDVCGPHEGDRDSRMDLHRD